MCGKTAWSTSSGVEKFPGFTGSLATRSHMESDQAEDSCIRYGFHRMKTT